MTPHTATGREGRWTPIVLRPSAGWVSNPVVAEVIGPQSGTARAHDLLIGA